MSAHVVGDVLAPVEFDVDRFTLRAYADASGDHNPIHLDDHAARALGLPGVIAHGMWTMGASLRLVEETFPGARITRAFTRFSRPVPVSASRPTRLRVTGTITSVDGPELGLALETLCPSDSGDERVAKMEVCVVVAS